MTRAVPAPRAAAIDWGVAARALPGETLSGDRHVVQSFPGGVLLGAMDGLGHGEEAADAAEIAARVLEERPHEPLPSLVQRCHDALGKTRGVVMSLASVKLREAAMTWLGVGNVTGVLMRADSHAVPAREALLLRGGVVGYKLPRLKAAVVALNPGDTLVFATDGIRGDFAEHLAGRARPQKLADGIMARDGLETDDALVLVARYPGRPR